MVRMPAISLVASPGQRRTAIDVAVEAEQRGFAGVYSPSMGDPVALCQAIAQATKSIPVGVAVEPIYFRSPQSMARTAASVHEFADGRFRLGIGVSHDPLNTRYHLQTGKPLADMRSYVAAMRALEPETGPLPPIVLATLRNRMVDLAAEVGDGAIWASASRSFTAQQLRRIPEAKLKAGFFVAAALPTVIDTDLAAAAAVSRRTLAFIAQFPNYRRYWREAGYVEEVDVIDKAIAQGEIDRLPSLLGDRLVSDCSLYGSSATVREGVEAWFEAGIVPILTMSSTRGGQQEGVGELFRAYA
ncbi:LLM class flavin-dependent oxidoreductase [Phenylobacterium sp.]|jgi:alkanesulfonate monooxygenase SsuD/methylene tetrahydromethanopterin reductase-like flavin-dependent oxidoreductase (luciferase family)|uniref:LLM class flavin-dependent oxidoreductase n=1 Tax=Phenylobacterium sp. TaxID=1871053 RepID=UPI002F3ECBF5